MTAAATTPDENPAIIFNLFNDFSHLHSLTASCTLRGL